MDMSFSMLDPLASDADRLDNLEAPFRDFLLLECLPIGLLVVDSKARIVFMNEHVEQILGYGRGELLGQLVETLVPERVRIQHAALRRLYAYGPRERRIGMGRDLVALRRDGSEIPVKIGLKPIQAEGTASCSSF